mgnify:CR=1 FL=1
MILHQLENPPGARKRKKRLGRGIGSTWGKTAGRGQKGQYARGTINLGFEGGQTPLHRRLPRRGFNNKFRQKWAIVNLTEFVRRPALAEKDTILVSDLVEHRVIRSTALPVKILAVGDLNRAVTVHAHQFSKAALDKIEAAGGKAIVIES